MKDTTQPAERIDGTAVEPGRDAPLKMDERVFREVGHALIDAIADFLTDLPGRPLTRDDTPEAVRQQLEEEAPFPERGADAESLLRSTAELLFDRSLFNGHPRFFGYVTSSPAPIGMLGDLLAAAVNANLGAWRLSPVATEIELQAVRWIADLVGYPTTCGGLMVSGGNVANSVGLLAARVAASDWDLRKEGFHTASARQLCVYASPETHTWIQKATDLSGIGTDGIRWIESDDDLRLSTASLVEAIRRDRDQGHLPMAVVATAGTVSTGAVDPLVEIGEICRSEGIWFHVDGAYGGFAAAVPGMPPDLGGLRLADSVALDPHKWLYAPLEAGCVLVRDSEALRAAFSYHPPYYHFGHEATNFHDLGPQNSRGFRALKVWLALRQVGREGYVRMIADDIHLSRRLHRLLDAHPAFDALTQGLSVTTFQYVPPDLRARQTSGDVVAYLNRLNEELVERIQSSGEVFVSNAVVRGRYALRACIVNFNTTAADIDAVPAIIERLGKEVDDSLRPAALSTGTTAGDG